MVRKGFEHTTFGLRVKCLAQGHTTHSSGGGSSSRPLGYERSALLKDTQRSGQAGVRAHDLWVMSEVPFSRTQRSGQAGVRTQDLWVTSKVPCSRTHNAVVRSGFELKTFRLRVKCLAQGHTTQWSGRGSNSRPLGYE